VAQHVQKTIQINDDGSINEAYDGIGNTCYGKVKWSTIKMESRFGAICLRIRESRQGSIQKNQMKNITTGKMVCEK